ncbi:MAG: dihydroorotase [Gammaproteobacteria bacterium]|nr:dihydroorotase [Gammaproteobacteria bacterium]MDD9895136.1 dihydroorotase [Gammaproteobacteria bacterium]MDD9958216.1 dihydroorotase [Gammaproteobacteria bacterium]
MNSDYLSITQPDDWHLHLRDADALQTTVPHTARAFGRAIVMPNLKPPVTTVALALEYRERILQHSGNGFNPLMTLYLTDNTSAEEIERISQTEAVVAVKYYPAGATTNSDNGVSSMDKVYDIIEKMAEHAVPLLIHGEVTDAAIDIFDREKVFIETVLAPLLQRYPTLKTVLEHITTKDATDFVSSQHENVAATITIHHLLYNRNDLLAGGVRPHFYCLPILKRDSHQQALIAAALSGSPKFFLGTDSAPHPKSAKETDCGCAGIYSAPAALELYAEFFDQHNALDKLEAFASFHGADFYGLPHNKEKIRLTKKAWTMTDDFTLGDNVVIPIRAGQPILWQID